MPQRTQQWAHWRDKAPTDVELHWNPDSLYSLQASDCNPVMLALYKRRISYPPLWLVEFQLENYILLHHL